ncbi:MAG: four-carbon acid sugar kinase family protein [Betaproteobacteria bacterium]|nr:four-carbon acid sugar kinase family protein [Betaproteobacteria bacterium]
MPERQDDKERVLIIADDLTGAMDAAGPFANRGLLTWVAALPEDCDPSRFAKATVVSVNTESRHLSPEQAAQRVEHAFRQVGGENFSVVVKKVDSTLRGNVVAETEALMSVARRDRALVSPAFPAQGRILRDGKVYVRGEPLENTSFARDALSPALAVPLREAFAGSGKRKVHSQASGGLQDPDFLSPGIVVADAESDADLASLARAGLAHCSRLVLVGSAGLTTALASQMSQEVERVEPPAVLGRIVYVVGSRAKASRDQAETLVADGARLVEAVNGRLRKEPVLAPGADVVLMAVPDKQGKEGDAGEVATMLARHAIRLVGPGNAQAIVATGGDTAIAFLRTSGNAALCVGGELLPGIAYARFMMGTRPVWLVTKAGGFGDPEALREIGRRLRVGAPAPA